MSKEALWLTHVIERYVEQKTLKALERSCSKENTALNDSSICYLDILEFVDSHRLSDCRTHRRQSWGVGYHDPQDSNPRPFRRKATNLLMSRHAPPYMHLLSLVINMIIQIANSEYYIDYLSMCQLCLNFGFVRK